MSANTNTSGFVSTARALWQPPEAHFAAAAHRAERFLSTIRLAVVGVLVTIAVLGLAADPGSERLILTVQIGLLVLGACALVHLAMVKGWAPEQIAFVGVVLEIGAVSLFLAAHMWWHSPLAGTNDRVLFPLYLLIIGATCLRYDSRISLLAGGLATTAYATIALCVGALASTGEDGLVSEIFGTYDWPTQAVRIVLLVTATAIATLNAQRIRGLVNVSTRDDLTGLLNRRVLDESVRQAIESGRPFVLVMFDVDRFKRLNDEHGHAIGDIALRHLASLLHRSFRTVDVVARYGGEEFAVVMVDGELNGCLRRIEAVREAVEVARLRIGRPEVATRRLPAISVSVGVSHWPDDGIGPFELMEAADKRLYEAKRLGRNRVVGPDPDADDAMLGMAVGD